jgi:hypothetical protein
METNKELIKMVEKNRRDPASATAILGLGMYAMTDSEQHFYLWKTTLAYIEELENELLYLKTFKDL